MTSIPPFYTGRFSGVSVLIARVVELGSAPKSNAQLQQDIDDILAKIVAGLTDSLNLYMTQLDTEQKNYDSTVMSLNALISDYTTQIANLQALIAKSNAALAVCQSALPSDQQSAATTQAAIVSLTALIANEQQQQRDAMLAYNAAKTVRLKQLSSIEACIQYVNDHIQGMTVAGLCHVDAPGCPRCLCNENCPTGQVCGNDAKCTEPVGTTKVGGMTTSQGGEGLTLSFSCPDGSRIISIDFASYGTPTGTFPNYQLSTCSASSSYSKTVSQCKLGSTSCDIKENNDIYGDPCNGTAKRLAVVATCSA